MATPFVGEIVIVPYNFAPRGFAFCDGQILAISQNTALFSLLGTTFGGNGTSNFALPNMQGSVPIGAGSGAGLTDRILGEVLGEGSHTLSLLEIPSHSHHLNGNNTMATVPSPSGRVPAEPNCAAKFQKMYAASGTQVTMQPNMVQPTGDSQPHNNYMQLLVFNFVIALQGVFPARP